MIALKDLAGAVEIIWATYGLARVAYVEGDLALAHQLARKAQDALTRLRIRHRLHDHIRELLARIEGGKEAATSSEAYK